MPASRRLVPPGTLPRPRLLPSLGLALLLPLFALPLRAETPESPAPAAPRLAAVSIDAALARARAHLASLAEPEREIVGLQFIPPHGRPGPGFWLVDLAPYPSDRPTPPRPVSSLLLSMDGQVEERGGRRPLHPEESRDRDQKAASLHRLMGEASTLPK